MSDEQAIKYLVTALVLIFAGWCLRQSTKKPKSNRRTTLPPPSRNCQRAYPDA